jgi:hypothetical protein
MMQMTIESSFEAIDKDARALVEFEKIRFDFAWRHFEFHARQRTTMFNFYILLLPFILAGFFYFLKEGNVPPTSMTAGATFVTAVGAVLTVVFGLLDVRNRQLYLISQKNLRLLESNFLYTTTYRAMRGSW